MAAPRAARRRRLPRQADPPPRPTPALHAPDEQAHFDYVQHLAEHRALPVCAPDQLRVSAGAWSPEVRALLTGRVNPIVFHAELPLPSPAAPALPAGPLARETSGCNYVSIYPPLYYEVAALGYRAVSAGTLYQQPGRKLSGAKLLEFYADVVSSHPVRVQLSLDRFGNLVIPGPPGQFHFGLPLAQFCKTRCRARVRHQDTQACPVVPPEVLGHHRSLEDRCHKFLPEH